MDTNRLTDYQLKDDGAFEIADYGGKPLFFSFLPGIAGMHGQPIWVFYTNRGQGVCSFGIENKQHSIMEYFPANQAAMRVELQGFRTFLRVDGKFFEPFAPGSSDRASMRIHLNQLELLSRNEKAGIEVKVVYFIAPECSQAALIRRVTVTNLADQARQLEVADGMPCVIPCGISHLQFKTEGSTFMAWADTQRLSTGEAFYGVHQSLSDNAQVTEPEDGYFYAAYSEKEICPVITDPSLIFDTDVSLQTPLGFVRDGTEIIRKSQYMIGKMPCAFSTAKKVTAPGQSMQLDSVFGYAENMDSVHQATSSMMQCLDGMQIRANDLISQMLGEVETKTSSPELDAYIGQCYLDNILRGGKPVAFQQADGKLIHYLYGRKHGDTERDYNEFMLSPTYYSQGNGNYRDLCQNRRSDVFFMPEAGLFNIKTFVELIQIDGYNPLTINGCTYRIPPEQIGWLTEYMKGGSMPDDLRSALQNGFDVGRLLHDAEAISQKLTIEPIGFVKLCMSIAGQQVESEFKAGYWSDHFTYIMDLIENYLAVFPDQLNALLYEERFRFHDSAMRVQPCNRQYTKSRNGIRRYNALACSPVKTENDFLMNRDGYAAAVSLYVKLLCLALNKFCCLDPGGMGIEMEAGKPGWNDSLNGLPGMLGSGIPETIELLRIIKFLLTAPGVVINMPCEIRRFADAADAAISQAGMERWRCLNTAKVAFRYGCYDGLSGDAQMTHTASLKPVLCRMAQVLEMGLEKAKNQYGPLIPTYLWYEVKEYAEEDGQIQPLDFAIHRLPDYLEAPARLMRSLKPEQAEKLHDQVKRSALWDDELKLFKVCDSLEGQSHEIGRARAFPRGWFENESVFLHMSYKYLLGLLEAGLYDAFFREMKMSWVPFFNVVKYGRSILENSSFIASDDNPDPNTHGRGYIARLSGATAEVLSMWLTMTTGGKPFVMENGDLCFRLCPKLVSWLFNENGELHFTMLGKTEFRIINREKLNTYEPGVQVGLYEIDWHDGGRSTRKAIVGKEALRIRNQEAMRIIVYVGKEE